ncbi:PREDICTED: olfactory receptor 1019-like [Nanorana parkeri]|uniref:olfactory receptor 1019-like n=1 Tax=Nanorana parkeri TaxID=125878 RepID=UPI000854D8C1|nr:PREDICTED: olfactory receptor 1019-like [Nanorana parkeri]
MALSKSSNDTFVNEFILTGFSRRPDLQIVFFLVFLSIYLITLLGNLLIVFAVCHNERLKTPMYYFLCSLSILDVCLSSDIAPNMLSNLLSEQKTISYAGCFVQLYFFCVLGSTECILFAVMAYDRYVAICNPLNYILVMQKKTCLGLICGAYMAGVVHSLIEVSCTLQLSFCASNVLHHFACDFPPLLSISCTDTTINEFVLFIFSSLITVPSILVIIVSYVSIIVCVLKIKSANGGLKAFSTCASHITAVTLCYGTTLYVYLSPKSESTVENRSVATVFYSVVIPMLNPIIYSLRNKDIHMAVKIMFQSKMNF